MFRIIVGVLAAFVGFSFGNSIPRWMENKSKYATEMQSPSSSESAHPVRKPLLRRKSLRKFKFGSQKPGKENLEIDESLQQLSKDIAEGTGPLKCSPTSPLCSSTRGRAEHKKLKFGSQKLLKEKVKNVSSFKGLDSPKLPISSVNVDNGSHPHQDASTNADNGRRSHQDASADVGEGCRSLQETCIKSKIGHPPQQELHAENGSPVKPKLQEPVFCKISSTQSICRSPGKEKSQMKQWKMKLFNLRSKAMASEKVWYEKFENEKYGGKLLAPHSKDTAKKQAKGKENENPQLTNTKRRDHSWSRTSSSKIGLLVECPKSTFER